MAGTYRAGTVTLTNGSAIVTGVGTAFLANVSVGDIFHLTTEDIPYVVASIATDTSLNLSAPYVGAGGAGLLYEITRDFTPLGIPIAQRGDLSPWAVLTQAFNKINTLLGQVGASLDIVAGDILFGSGPKILSRLAAGANGLSLKLIGGLPSWQPSREVLTANRTYYVRSDGSDLNDGLADTSGGAFATLQAAYNKAVALDFNGFDVTLNATLGTALAGVSITKPWVGGNLNITLGAGVVVTPVSSAIEVRVLSGILRINGSGKLTAAGSGACILLLASGVVEFTGIEFGATGGGSHLHSQSAGAKILATGAYSISGAASSHALASGAGYVEITSKTITITGTLAITNFVVSQVRSAVRMSANTFVGDTIGKKFGVIHGSALITLGSTLPGDQAGTTEAGSFSN